MQVPLLGRLRIVVVQPGAMSSLVDQTRWMNATDQAALVANGEVTPSELLEAAIERIEQSNPALNAVVIEWFDHARSVAADPDLPDGPFRGVPFLLRDLYASFAGQTLSNGNRALKEAGKIDAADTTLVARFKAAGLVIAGRTNSPEMGSLPTTQPLAWGRPATRGRWSARRAGRVAAPPRRWPSGWSRSPMPRTGVAASASRRRAAGWSGLKPSQGRHHGRAGARRGGAGGRVGHQPHRARHSAAARCGARPRHRRHRDRAGARATLRRRGRRRPGSVAHRAARRAPARRLRARGLRHGGTRRGV